MQVLLDECLPRDLRTLLAGHKVRTVAQMGWAGKKNGELMALARASGFEVFVTADRSVPYQQNLSASGLGVVILSGGSTRLPDLIPLVPEILKALITIHPGDVVTVTQ
jgi:hypothetical protein